MDREFVGYAVVATKSVGKDVVGCVTVYSTPDSSSGGYPYWSTSMFLEKDVGRAVNRFRDATTGYLAKETEISSIKLVEVFVELNVLDETSIELAEKKAAIEAARRHLTADQLKILGLE